jgi:hypothetical protein
MMSSAIIKYFCQLGLEQNINKKGRYPENMLFKVLNPVICRFDPDKQDTCDYEVIIYSASINEIRIFTKSFLKNRRNNS